MAVTIFLYGVRKREVLQRAFSASSLPAVDIAINGYSSGIFQAELSLSYIALRQTHCAKIIAVDRG